LTIQRAVDMVGPGDTIRVKDGIYREAITVGVSGTEAAPITLQAYGNDRPVISGASRITGWTRCTSNDAQGNPQYANIYFADIDRRITTLYQDNVRRWKSRLPEHGFWSMESGTATTITDTQNLSQPDDFWKGAEVFNRIAQSEA
jgi:pectin methylesterase-like acyl-CoA thioesterase